MKNLILAIIIIIIINSCNESINPDYFDKICGDNSEFMVDSSRATYVTEANHKYLSMRSIAVPSDTFLLRVEYFTDTTMKIFEYSFYKLKTSYKIYTFPVNESTGQILFDKSKDTLIKYFKNVGSQGIDKGFITQLERASIFELTSSDKIKNYPADFGRIYTIEYSNRCKYNLVDFTNPYGNSKKFKEAKSLVTFLEYLKKEFNF